MAKRRMTPRRRTRCIWNGILTRCTNPKNPAFKFYGGRGITVCPEWHCFETFLTDMGFQPTGFQIDRIDGNKGYSKDNCRWVTPREQQRNKIDVVQVVFNGEPRYLSDLEAEAGLTHGTIWHRLFDLGWTLEEAVRPTSYSNAARYPFNGKMLRVGEIVKLTGVSRHALNHRLKKGQDAEAAVREIQHAP